MHHWYVLRWRQCVSIASTWKLQRSPWRIVSVQTLRSSQPPAVRAVPTGSDILFISPNLFLPSLLKGLHKIRIVRFPSGWVIKIIDKFLWKFLTHKRSARRRISYYNNREILSFATNLVNLDRFFLLNVNEKNIL